MKRLKRGGFIVVLACAAAVMWRTSEAHADEPLGAEPTRRELMAEIEALKARLQALEHGQKNQQEKLDKATVDATVSRVLDDADRRSRLVDEDQFTAGFLTDKGFVLRSADGDFLLHPYLQFLFRCVSNYREDAKPDGDDDFQNGFEVRRMKLGFDGNLWGPDFKYLFLWATDRKTGNLGLEEAYFIYKMGDVGLPEPLSVQGGQFKNYFAHEAMSSSRKIFAAERSFLNNVFTGGDDFIQGVGLLYNEGTKGGPLRASLLFNDGSNDFNRNFQDFPVGKWDFGAAARVEYKAFGDWTNYEDFTAYNLKAPLLVFGGAIDYSEAGDFAQFRQTADVQYKSGRIALYGAFLGRLLRHAGIGGAGTVAPSPAGAGIDNFYDYGFVSKAGYMLSKNWEVFGQYSYTQFDIGEFAPGADSTVHEITTGVNWYIRAHSAKLTADFTWLPNGAPLADDGAGILAQPTGGNELLFRTQFQLLL